LVLYFSGQSIERNILKKPQGKFVAFLSAAANITQPLRFQWTPRLRGEPERHGRKNPTDRTNA
jgi:hypothetical protein